MTTFTQVLSYIQTEPLSDGDLQLIIEAVKYSRSRNARVAARTLRPGQKVQFQSRGGPLSGILHSIKIKNAVVETGVGRFRVPLSMLEPVA
jgi:hypothetical protein